MSEADSEADGRWIVLQAGAEAAGLRLDQWLAKSLAPDMSRSLIQALVRQGAVTLDGRTASETGRRLSGGEHIVLAVPTPSAPVPAGEAIPLAILHEDAELIVVDKPAGLVVHPGAGNWTGTLVNALIHHCGDGLAGIGGVRRPGIVHRLDKNTSGVMVAAKTDRAHAALSAAFADHGRTGRLERAYAALVWGAPERPSGAVDAPLGRAADRVRRAVVAPSRSDARSAVTHFAVEERFGQPGDEVAALLECRLETGRTHQIRVHMAHIGHPVIGDTEYGQGFRTKANRLPEPLRTEAKDFPRQALHAKSLAFPHPATGAMLRFESPLPADMSGLLSGLRKL